MLNLIDLNSEENGETKNISYDEILKYLKKRTKKKDYNIYIDIEEIE